MKRDNSRPVHVELDARKRVNLGKLAQHRLYLARLENDGTIILEPAVVMTEFEARVLGNPAIIAALRAAQQSGRGLPRRKQ